MAVFRCPNCLIPCLEGEVERGVCPGCNATLGSSPGYHDDSTRGIARPRRIGSFVAGLLIGCLVGLGALWGALRLGAPIPGWEIEDEPAFQAILAEKTEAENQAQESDTARRAAESAHAQISKARDEANRQAMAVLKQQKEDMQQQLQETVDRLEDERGRREVLEKALADAKKAKPEPTLSFVRDWQLLGPFASKSGQGHDMVYPPERELFQLHKVYNGFGGQLKWRSYHSPEDKIDLARFFQYYNAGAAYAVSWVYSDQPQIVTLAIGSDDGICVWFNGGKVHDIKGGRNARPGQDIVRARLRKGWNEIRTKVDNIVGTWEFYVEFRTADGRQPLKVLSTSSPPTTPG